MGRYTGPVCRKCRRVGEKLFLKGDRCYTSRCAVDRRNSSPGMQTQRRRRISDWGIHLREKQKARWTYGIFEQQFANYFDLAKLDKGPSGDVLLQILERRLDNVIFRLSFVDSRAHARQLVNHGHFTVNGKKINIPSYLVKPNDVIDWIKQGEDIPEFVTNLTEGLPKRPVPEWLSLDVENLQGKVLSIPAISAEEMGIETRLIVEFYSK
jgi:small subunit ribosomal protein S4